jgi:hypothetical protein
MDSYIDDAKRIWNEYKTKMGDSKFKKLDSEIQLSYFQKNNPSFAKNFSIVLRYMIQLQKYHPKAFKKFILKMQRHPYRTKLEYCERQADYVKYLYMETTPRYSAKDANAIWTNAYDILKKEVEVFDQAEKAVKEKLAKNNKSNSIERREELKKLLNSLSI